jgi:hypothetical protein
MSLSTLELHYNLMINIRLGLKYLEVKCEKNKQNILGLNPYSGKLKIKRFEGTNTLAYCTKVFNKTEKI